MESERQEVNEPQERRGGGKSGHPPRSKGRGLGSQRHPRHLLQVAHADRMATDALLLPSRPPRGVAMRRRMGERAGCQMGTGTVGRSGDGRRGGEGGHTPPPSPAPGGPTRGNSHRDPAVSSASPSFRHHFVPQGHSLAYPKSPRRASSPPSASSRKPQGAPPSRVNRSDSGSSRRPAISPAFAFALTIAPAAAPLPDRADSGASAAPRLRQGWLERRQQLLAPAAPSDCHRTAANRKRRYEAGFQWEAEVGIRGC